MAFKRVVKVILTSENNSIIISDLNISFEIERSIKIDANSCKLTIYNVKEETRKKFLKKDSFITIQAGYEDENNLASIFTGLIFEATTKKTRTENIVDVIAYDFGSLKKNILNEMLSLSYAGKTPLVNILMDVTNFMAIPVSGIENIASIILNNGFVFVGTIQAVLNQIKNILVANGLSLYIDSSELVIYSNKVDLKYSVVNLSSNLIIGNVEINEEEEKKKKIKVVVIKTLLNPKIRPRNVININSDILKTVLAVRKVTHVGDNFGGSEFTSTVECVE